MNIIGNWIIPNGQYSQDLSLMKKFVLKYFCTADFEWRKNTELLC